MQFVPTPAGTYQLQRIQECPDAQLLDSAGRARQLSALTRGKITLLTFFYTHCTDPLGCPYAFGLMAALSGRIVADPDLRANVRFVSISFDPTHDSPAQLRSYARGFSAHARFEWDFLTAPSIAMLQPLLDDFGQDVRIEQNAHARVTCTRSTRNDQRPLSPLGRSRWPPLSLWGEGLRVRVLRDLFYLT